MLDGKIPVLVRKRQMSDNYFITVYGSVVKWRLNDKYYIVVAAIIAHDL